MNASMAQIGNRAAEKNTPAFERHYSPEQLAELWNVSADTVRRMFEKEPGVLILLKPGGTRRMFRIPASVADRVYRRMTNPELAKFRR